MDRGVPGERRAGRAAEQFAHDRRQVADGYHGPAAVRRVFAGRRPIPDRVAVHIHSSGVRAQFSLGYVFIFRRRFSSIYSIFKRFFRPGVMYTCVTCRRTNISRVRLETAHGQCFDCRTKARTC